MVKTTTRHIEVAFEGRLEQVCCIHVILWHQRDRQVSLISDVREIIRDLRVDVRGELEILSRLRDVGRGGPGNHRFDPHHYEMISQ